MLTISVFYPVNTKMPNKKLNILVQEDLDYADDIGLLSSKHQDAQQKAEHLSPRRSRHADDIGLLSSKHQDAQQKAEHLSPIRSRLC